MRGGTPALRSPLTIEPRSELGIALTLAAQDGKTGARQIQTRFLPIYLRRSPHL